MSKHHTKEKGDLGVFKAMTDLHSKGFTILTPQTEHAAFDLAAYKDKKFTRIQVKYRTINKYGTLYVKLSSSWADRNGSHSSLVDKDEIDIYCIYCPDTDVCYYVDPKEFGNSISLRITDPKKHNPTIRFAKDYLNIE